MRITKLHLILLAIAALVIGFYVLQVQQEKKHREEIAALMAQREAEQKRIAEEQRQKVEREKKKELAVQAVAVAGEYWIINRKERRAVEKGQETLRRAKDELAKGNHDEAWTLARRSIEEFKAAPLIETRLFYTVRRGDSLWKIAKMPRHYGRGSLWPRIWRANEKKIPDFDVIRPRQVLLIPKVRKTSL